MLLFNGMLGEYTSFEKYYVFLDKTLKWLCLKILHPRILCLIIAILGYPSLCGTCRASDSPAGSPHRWKNRWLLTGKQLVETSDFCHTFRSRTTEICSNRDVAAVKFMFCSCWHFRYMRWWLSHASKKMTLFSGWCNNHLFQVMEFVNGVIIHVWNPEYIFGL